MRPLHISKNSVFILGKEFLKIDLIKIFDRYNDDYREDDKIFYLTTNDLLIDPENFWEQWGRAIDFYKQENNYYLNLIVDLISRKKIKKCLSFTPIPIYSDKRIFNINGTLDEIICCKCRRIIKYEVFKNKLERNYVCYECGGYYKPDIRFLEESYHNNYYKAINKLAEIKNIFLFDFFASGRMEKDFLLNIDETSAKIFEINNKGIQLFETSKYIDISSEEYLEKLCSI